MSMTCETVRVQREKCPENPTGIVVINKDDLTANDVLAEGEESVVTAPTEPVASVEPAVQEQAAPWLRK